MTFPRAIALSEVVWSSNENKSYSDFVHRLEYFQKRLDEMKVNYANHLYEVRGKLLNENEVLLYQLETTTEGKNIRYTTDNSNPNNSSKLYTEKIKIGTSSTIKAAVFNTEGTQLGNLFEKKIKLHKAIGKKITLNTAPHRAYNAGGKQALINGISGNNKRYGDKEWLGFSGDDVEITIEFDKPTTIHSISTRFHNGNGQWIYAPKEIKITFDDTKTEKFSIVNNNELLVYFNQKIKDIEVKKIKLSIPNYGIIEEGKQGSGHKAWTFIDEIVVE